MRTMLRGGRFMVQVAVVLGLVGGLPARPAHAQTSAATQVMALVNSTRASVGAPPVRVDPGLSAVAQSWAATMASQGRIMHNPDLRSQVVGWTALAENVGVGSSVEVVHRVLVASPGHYANMTDRRFTTGGAGVAAAGGQVYVVQVFTDGGRAAAQPSPPVAVAEPEPASAPVVAHPAPVPPAPAPAPVATPDPTPVPAPSPPAPESPPGPAPAPTPTATPAPSNWLALVLQQLQALDRAFG